MHRYDNSQHHSRPRLVNTSTKCMQCTHTCTNIQMHTHAHTCSHTCTHTHMLSIPNTHIDMYNQHIHHTNRHSAYSFRTLDTSQEEGAVFCGTEGCSTGKPRQQEALNPPLHTHICSFNKQPYGCKHLVPVHVSTDS